MLRVVTPAEGYFGQGPPQQSGNPEVFYPPRDRPWVNQERPSQTEYLSPSPLQSCQRRTPGTLSLTFLKLEPESLEDPFLNFHSSKTSLQKGCSQLLKVGYVGAPWVGQAPAPGRHPFYDVGAYLSKGVTLQEGVAPGQEPG